MRKPRILDKLDRKLLNLLQKDNLLPTSELARVPGFAPTPGMPAEILIQTAERTFFEYLSKPIRDSMARAFMEP